MTYLVCVPGAVTGEAAWRASPAAMETGEELSLHSGGLLGKGGSCGWPLFALCPGQRPFKEVLRQTRDPPSPPHRQPQKLQFHMIPT